MGANIDAIYSELSKHNDSLKQLIEENTRLNETIFKETGKERVERLIEIANKRNQNLEKVIDAINTDLGKSISMDTLVDDLTKLRDEIKNTKKQLKGLTKKDKDFDTLTKQLEEQTEAYNLLNNAASNYFSAANDAQKELNERQLEGIHILDDIEEKWEQRTKAVRKGFDEIKKGSKQAFDAVTKTLEPWSKANQEAMAYAKTMGMSQKTADAYLNKTVSWASKNNIGILFNKTTAELIKMQGKYSEVLGRNVQLTDTQKKDMLAMETFLGEDGMMDIANNLENYGLGMSDSADFVKKTMDEATKSGIAASKLTKTIRENIKMAQNYTFKKGLDGLTSMAKKAIELKTDMSLINSFAEKTSTVEGAITTGAQLQVLGGSYALGSDPLSMMYESLNDVEGLFDRAVNMAKGKVYYDEKTGNFEMGAMDRYMMKQAATAMGIDPSKMMDVAYRQASLGRIEGQARLNSKIAGDEEMMELVKNLATWGKGKAVVNIGGKDVNVSGLTSSDKEKLEQMQRTDSQNLQEMAISLRSMEEIMSGTQKEINNEQANLLKGIGEGINGMLRNNTGLLNTIAKIGAWFNVINGSSMLLGGIWGTTKGIYRVVLGSRNLVGNGGGSGDGIDIGRGVVRKGRNAGLVGRSKQLVRVGKNHGFKGIVRMGKTAMGRGVGRTAASIAGKAGSKAIGAAGAAGAVFSIGTDMLTGDFKKNAGGSIAKGIASGVGGAVGMYFGGPGGAVVGSLVASGIVSGVEWVAKKYRKKFREKIYEELSTVNPNFAGLFSGDNALEGNYSKRQLEQIKAALADGVIDESELKKGTLRKARASNDLEKMRNAGAQINTQMADGGQLPFNLLGRLKDGIARSKYGKLIGPSHANGGIPIPGTGIEVEGEK